MCIRDSSVIGGVCIFASIILLVWLPRSISKPIQELTRGILEIANHNSEKRLDRSGHEEFREVADSFNRMAERLTDVYKRQEVIRALMRWELPKTMEQWKVKKSV